ncbi:hypothetical protein GCM10010219_14250 [Streptomyces netropsis]|nr:hypothetical protein GCM10010219_14250 [Streptomyces netropsis]
MRCCGQSTKCSVEEAAIRQDRQIREQMRHGDGAVPPARRERPVGRRTRPGPLTGRVGAAAVDAPARAGLCARARMEMWGICEAQTWRTSARVQELSHGRVVREDEERGSAALSSCQGLRA